MIYDIVTPCNALCAWVNVSTTSIWFILSILIKVGQDSRCDGGTLTALMEWDGITSWHSLVTLQTFGSFKQFASLKPFGPFDTLHILLTFSLRISLTVPSTDLSFCAKVMNQSKITECSWLRKAVNSIKVWLLTLLLLFLLLLFSWPRPGQVCWFP